jgi:hypothetical protein
MNHLSSRKRQYVEMLPIDVSKVGKRIANGAQCDVSEFGTDGVIKMPLDPVTPWKHIRKKTFAKITATLLGVETYDNAQRNLEICRKYFGEYVLPMEIIPGKNGKYFCILQDRIQPQELTPNACPPRSRVHDQLAEIVAMNRCFMKDTGVTLDGMGFDAWKLATSQPYLKNIVMCDPVDGPGKNSDMRIIDTGTIPLPENACASLRLYCKTVLRIHDHNYKKFGLKFF